MASSLLLLPLLLLLPALTEGASLPEPGCPPQICYVVDCALPACNFPGVMVQGAGYCGCCPACVWILDEGAACDGGINLMQTRCKTGLTCDAVTNTCRRQ